MGVAVGTTEPSASVTPARVTGLRPAATGYPGHGMSMNHDPSFPDLERSILRTVAYSDVFDYPLSHAEVHRYLDATAAATGEVGEALHRLTGTDLCAADDWVALAGREDLFALRQRRRRIAEDLWPAARRWARTISRLPLVRMVSVTGALAVNNVDHDADVDYLIVTEPGRVWLCRTMVVQIVRLARLGGVVICPNWLLAADALTLADRSLFAARELSQMVPLTGLELYRRMRRLNPWAAVFLPNAAGPPCPVAEAAPPSKAWTGFTERMLLGRTGAGAEVWMRRRKAREILRANPETPEVVLDRHQCKGHVDAHGERIRRAYAERLSTLGLEPTDSAV